jgi:hypothetical protein
MSLCIVCAVAGCYRGGEREKDPPPGYPGGFCLAPDGTCEEGLCDVSGGAYCYDPAAPCHGVYCGGNGVCLITQEGKPSCQCDPGYNNETYSLFCDLGAGMGGEDAGDDEGMMTRPDAGG